MGNEGLLVLVVSIIRASAPVQLDVTPLQRAAREDRIHAIDFARVTPLQRAAREDRIHAIDFVRELPAKQVHAIELDLADNSAEGDWSRQPDYELVATRGVWSLAVNNNLIVRNIDEAQVVASYTIEY